MNDPLSELWDAIRAEEKKFDENAWWEAKAREKAREVERELFEGDGSGDFDGLPIKLERKV